MIAGESITGHPPPEGALHEPPTVVADGAIVPERAAPKAARIRVPTKIRGVAALVTSRRAVSRRTPSITFTPIPTVMLLSRSTAFPATNCPGMPLILGTQQYVV